MNRLLRDRREAGVLLAGMLKKYESLSDTLVFALPRGGVPVAFEVSRALKLPLDVFMVRKLGAPGNPELAIGAIAFGGVTVLNDDIVNWLNISEAEIRKVTEIESLELNRRLHLYRKGSHQVIVKDKTIIIIDDGLATGASMKSALKALRKLGAKKIIAAVPVAPASTCDELSETADEVVCYMAPDNFSSVGEWYEDFSQTTDEEVRQLLVESEEYLKQF